ncbi:MAG: XdhC family protein [Myxococcota bacterium]
MTTLQTGAPEALSSLDLLVRASDWRKEGRKVALATVVKTWGSSPRQPGSLLVIRDDGLFEGSVSGGCVEGEVVRAALEVMEGAPSKILEYGVSHEKAWEVGLACGGRIEIFVESLG